MGLEALLGPKVVDSNPPGPRTPATLKLTLIQPGKYQPRTHMDESALAELATSIKTQGLIQPVLVRPVNGGRYEIIAGERRVRAAGMAGLDEVPVLVREVPDEAAAVMALVENIQREDLNPLEEAQGLQRLITEFKFTHEQAAQAVGRSRSAASNLMRLLNLSVPVQKLLLAGDIEMGHARALLPLPSAQQILCANEIVAKRLSVREAEKRASQTIAADKSPGIVRQQPRKSRDLLRLEELLADKMTAPVEIRLRGRTKHGEQGEIALGFRSLDELNSLLDKLGVADR